MSDLIGRKNRIIQTMNDVILYVEPESLNINTGSYSKISINNLSALGVAFEPLTAAFQNIFGHGSASGIYKVTVLKGMHLAEFKNGLGNLGTYMDTENHLVGQSVINPLVCDPTMLFMSMALHNIQQKLDSIEEKQEEIFGFMAQKERSSIKGNINFLTDILNNYKYNWNNELYKNSNHIKVLDIKQESEKNIDFYREQIADKISKKNLIHGNSEVKKQIEKIVDDFKEYQLSLYSFAFSSFLEIMLLENFDKNYLNGVSEKIEMYSLNYRELYSQCYDIIEGNSNTTVQSAVIKGFASISKAFGKTIEKIPLISNTQLDENLIANSDKIKEFGDNKTDKTLRKLTFSQNNYVRPFIDSINSINRLHNEEIDLYVDEDYIYISE